MNLFVPKINVQLIIEFISANRTFEQAPVERIGAGNIGNQMLKVYFFFFFFSYLLYFSNVLDKLKQSFSHCCLL